ncbi:hypothetical protein [Microbispora sp. NPDC049125]|uniref:hypothetical protein n=1 Tax=Microbispora sp. NPDC049125 TaxID=3154929 RepID=UPI003467C55D
MTLRWLLRIVAIYLGALGAASLLVPQAASSGLGHALTPFDIFAARTIGATLLTIAILNWSASMSALIPVGVVLANVFMNAVLGTVDATNIIGGTIGAGSWSGVAIHAALVLAFSLCLFRAMRRHKAARLA